MCKETRNPLPTLQVTINVNIRELKKKINQKIALLSSRWLFLRERISYCFSFPGLLWKFYPLPNPRYFTTAEIYSVTVRRAGI